MIKCIIRYKGQSSGSKMTGGCPNILVMVSTTISLVVYYGVAVSNVTCGQTITEDTTLTSDLTCPASAGDAITIMGSNVTLDLGGHTLKSETPAPNDSYGVTVQGVGQVTGVRITNGTIEGFSNGIGVVNASDVTVDNMSIKSFITDDPDISLTGVSLYLSQNIVVKDSQFDFHHNVAHRYAVAHGDSNLSVRNITSNGGMVSIGFCDNLTTPHFAEVIDSKFSNVFLGVWIACTKNTHVARNTFTDCNNAIQADAAFAGAITGLNIEDNLVTTSVSPALGIQFRGVNESTISENVVKGHDAWGITVGRSLGCIDPVNNPDLDCFYSTDNLISGNVALENGIDLFHDTGSTPNTWENNTCLTTEGADIPACDCPDWLCGGGLRGWRLQLLRQSK